MAMHLLFGLEVLIAADIIGTILEPNHQSLLILGGMVLIRTVIAYFLEKELQAMNNE